MMNATTTLTLTGLTRLALTKKYTQLAHGIASNMGKVKYTMSFTTGGLFLQGSVKLADLYLLLTDWHEVTVKALSANLLQTRTVSTSKRLCREIVSRLKMLSYRELELLVQGTPQEQAQLLWLAVCRRYKFIADFAVEVLHEKYIGLQTDLRYTDFESFFHKKSEWHSELDAIKPATRNKLRQVLFRILQDADLLTGNSINPAILSPRVHDIIQNGNAQEFLFFPSTELGPRGRAQ